MTNDELEERLKDKDAERVTYDQIKNSIKQAHYLHPLGTITICIIELHNGFTTIGHSACADPELYDEELGKELAYDHAFGQLWPLFGFSLKERLFGSPEAA